MFLHILLKVVRHPKVENLKIVHRPYRKEVYLEVTLKESIEGKGRSWVARVSDGQSYEIESLVVQSLEELLSELK